jgi:hypothetical protein
MAPHSILDAEFDQAMLDGLTRGDAEKMASYFDGRRPVVNPDDPKSLNLASGGTQMVLGLGGGTGETRNWIIATAVADGLPGTVVDYVPVYASPVGLGFAYWNF